MAVNSKADKTHGLKSSGESKPAYTTALPTVDPLSGKLGTAGQKALLTRAKKVLAPLADPSQSAF